MRMSILVLAALLLPTTASAEALEDLGPAPDFTLPVHGGGEATLSEVLAEGPVIVDFWATWCRPCKRALPRYQVLYEKYQDQGLRVLAVSQDDPRSQSKIGAFFRSQKLTFPALLDTEKKIGRLFGVQSLPVTFLVHPDGRIVAAHTGYRDGDERVLEAQVKAVLADIQKDAPEPAPADPAPDGR